MSSAKENANPTLFSVENRDRYAHTQRDPLDWSKIGTFRQENKANGRGGSSMVVVPISAADKAILRAITDSSRSTTNGKGVGLLRKSGLVIPTHSSDVAGLSKGVSSSCYSNSSRPVFELVEESEETSDVEETSCKQNENENSNNNESKITAEEIFDIIRTIQDPEHPNSLEQLGVVSLEQVEASLASDSPSSGKHDEITVRFTPTIPHCSMATLIGLCLRVKLHRSLPPTRFKVDVSIEPGTHVSEKAINKQLRDKERVRAALENKHLAGVVDKCIRNGMMMTKD